MRQSRFRRRSDQTEKLQIRVYCRLLWRCFELPPAEHQSHDGYVENWRGILPFSPLNQGALDQLLDSRLNIHTRIGLSQRSVKVIKAGVVPERIAPGKPQQNGRLERLHLTLLRDAADPPAPSLRAQRHRLRSFQRLYNEERPHQALGNDTPAQHYALSPRRFDGMLREPGYDADQTVRRVRRNGEIKWQGRTIYINEALSGEPVGLGENAEGDWTVCFGPIVLGVIRHHDDRLRKPKPQACGLLDNAARCPPGPQAQQPPQQP